MKYILKTTKLLLKSENKNNNTFIYTGSPNKDQKGKGKLVVLLDFPEGTKAPKELGNLLVQRIHKLYYNSSLDEQESILENILEEVNENLPLITEVDANWLKQFKALIAIVYRQEVYFSPLGNISAWVTNNNELVNIFDYLDNDIDKPSINKTFTNILSGNIEPNQSLFFTTNTLFDYVSEEKLSNIIKEGEFSGITIKLKELLYQVKNQSFCSVFIKLIPYEKDNSADAEIKRMTEPKEKSSEESINKLLKTQEQTEEILTKSKTEIENEEVTEKNVMNFAEEEVEQENKNKQKIIKKEKNNENFKKFLQKISDQLSKIKFKKPNSKIKNLIKFPTNAISRTQSGDLKMKTFNNNKTILIAALVILITFIGTIIFNKYNKQIQLEKEKYQEIVESIEEKQEEYDLLSIYKDENQAKEKLEEISNLLNSLPQKTANQKERYQDALSKFTEMLNKVRKLNTITDLNIITELDFTPSNIFKHGNSIILSKTDNPEIKSLDLKNKNIENIWKISDTNIQNYVKDKNFIYALGKDKIKKVNIDNKEEAEMNIAFHPNFKNASDLIFYGERLYILDSESEQIYKHNMGENNFSKGEVWLKDNTDLNNVNSLSIDGNIYIGKNNGEFLRLYSGVINNLELEKIDPELKNIDKIYTDKTIQEIYLMDEISKRIIIINKKGELINQYYFPTLEKINNFIIDGASKKIYLQSENKIIEFKI